MVFSVNLGKYQFEISADTITKNKSGIYLSGSKVHINLPFHPEEYYMHGWQSWSLTTWLDVDTKLESLFPRVMRPMYTDLPYEKETSPHGSWIGAVTTPEKQVLLLGGLDIGSHIFLKENCLLGGYETGGGSWFLVLGQEQDVFIEYCDNLRGKLGVKEKCIAPKVWCSWYSLFQKIDEKVIINTVKELEEFPFDVIQVDDGWQRKIGDWEANSKFPHGMKYVAESIKETGKQAGIWLAPLIIPSSGLITKEHPDWLLHDDKGDLVSAGINWKEQQYALDTTNPNVMDWLVDLMKKVRAWGYDYVKLDFLYAGALPGKRMVDIYRETAYRDALLTIRNSLGDAYLAVCGAPILPSLGLCDGIRIGPDVSKVWCSQLASKFLNNYSIPGMQNAIRTSVNRLWLKPLINTDPDVVYFSEANTKLTDIEINLQKDLTSIAGVKGTSDLPEWLTGIEKKKLIGFMENDPIVEHIDRYEYTVDGRLVDFEDFINLIPSPNRFGKTIQKILNQLAESPIIWTLFEYLKK